MQQEKKDIYKSRLTELVSNRIINSSTNINEVTKTEVISNISLVKQDSKSCNLLSDIGKALFQIQMMNKKAIEELPVDKLISNNKNNNDVFKSQDFINKDENQNEVIDLEDNSKDIEIDFKDIDRNYYHYNCKEKLYYESAVININNQIQINLARAKNQENKRLHNLSDLEKIKNTSLNKNEYKNISEDVVRNGNTSRKNSFYYEEKRYIEKNRDDLKKDINQKGMKEDDNILKRINETKADIENDLNQEDKREPGQILSGEDDYDIKYERKNRFEDKSKEIVYSKRRRSRSRSRSNEYYNNRNYNKYGRNNNNRNKRDYKDNINNNYYNNNKDYKEKRFYNEYKDKKNKKYSKSNSRSLSRSRSKGKDN